MTETTAQQQLLDQRADAVATARALVGRQESEDIAQEALLRALRAARRGTPIADPRAYLRAIVRNVAWDLLRSRRAELLTEAPPEIPSAQGDPHLGARLGEMAAAIDSLPGGQRTALLATALTAHDQRRLATRLNTSQAGVRQLVRRARHHLRDSLGTVIPAFGIRLGELFFPLAAPASGGAGALAMVVVAIAAPSVRAPQPPLPPEPLRVPAIASSADRLDTDHSPFLAAPRDTALLLDH